MTLLLGSRCRETTTTRRREKREERREKREERREKKGEKRESEPAHVNARRHGLLEIMDTMKRCILFCFSIVAQRPRVSPPSRPGAADGLLAGRGCKPRASMRPWTLVLVVIGLNDIEEPRRTVVDVACSSVIHACAT